MKATCKIKNLPVNIKKQMRTALLLLCAVTTFITPAFCGGYSAIQKKQITGNAASIQDVDLLLVAASAFGEARKVMNASDNEAKDKFVENTSLIIGSRWQNIGLIIGARDALSGSTWSVYQDPITLSVSEIETYGGGLEDAYNKYKAFGFAMQNLINDAKNSKSSAVSVEEGLDAMSKTAIRLGSFGMEFLNTYNPAPVLLALYDSSNLGKYNQNKLVQIVTGNPVLKNIICLFGDPVLPGVSFFLIINAVLAVTGFALSMFLTLLGNRNIGDAVRSFMIKIVVGTVGIYVIANVMSILLGWVAGSVMNIGTSDTTSYVENNLNLHDWYLTGFQLPSGVSLQIDSTGRFVFTEEVVRKINEYTSEHLNGSAATDEGMKIAMTISSSLNNNIGTASFTTPTMKNDGENEAWATDVYYALMDNYAQNKDLLYGNDDESSALYGKTGLIQRLSRYLWMSSLRMEGGSGGWTVTGNGTNDENSPNYYYYGLNPISAFNLIRSDFSGDSIDVTATVYPELPYVAFDVVNSYTSSSSNNMNSLIRFIASFTLILAAIKGLITIFTAGFGGMFSGGIKTALGSSSGLGQALGGVITVIVGVIGISVIMSMSLSLLDTVYGIAKDLIGQTEVLTEFLQPLQDWASHFPVVGALGMKICRGIAEMILTLVMGLTFPKLGGIPITVFSQYMSELPGRIAEKAQMIEGMLLSGRSSAGGGLGGHGRSQSGQLAQQMAKQAFSSGTRQAASVVKAGIMGGAALAGASLSAAGKALNKKADSMEGKPKNPGVGNWDDMTPEQQAKAAEAAENMENWNNMSEDARQEALKEAGIYDDNNASAGSGTSDNEQTDNPVMETETPAAGSEDEPPAVEDDSPDIKEVGEEASMNGTKEAAGNAGGIQEVSEEAGLNGNSAQGETAGIENTGTGQSSNEHVESTNVNEGDHIEGGSQQLDTKINQKNNMDSKNVDESKQLNNEAISDLNTNNMDNRSTANMGGSLESTGSGKTPGTVSAGEVPHAGNSIHTSGNTEKHSSAGQQSGASATYKSVNNTSQTGGSSNVNVNAKASQNTQFNTGGVTEKQTVNEAASGSLEKDGMNAQAKKAAQAGGSSQSMNSTAQSKWGREMTIKEQKQARALHAAGDALQMIGGNRSMGEGIRDALGYAAEGMASAVVPPEMMNGIAMDIRNRRQLRQELRRQSIRNERKKK